MVKLIKDFRGVPNGAIYPVHYKGGDECPPELLAGALELGAVESAPSENAEKLDLFAKLDAAEIKYDKRWGVEKLAAALAEGKKD